MQLVVCDINLQIFFLASFLIKHTLGRTISVFITYLCLFVQVYPRVDAAGQDLLGHGELSTSRENIPQVRRVL